MLKSLLLCSFLFIGGLAMSDELCDDPNNYWNFENLKQVPAFEDSPFEDSKAEGMRDILFDGVGPNGTPAKVFAYVSYPKAPAPSSNGYPGIVLVHGGGGTAMPYYVRMWNDYGYAVIALDWYNSRPIDVERVVSDYGPECKAELEGGRRQDHVSAVSNMVLSHSLLRSLDNVDEDNICYVGLSWGSWYGAMVAAVDNRFKSVVEIYLGDYTGDPKSFINGRFLHAAKVPMYWVAGTNDGNGSPATLQAGFDHCANVWNKSLVVRLPHSHIGFAFDSCRRVADHFLKGEPDLPHLGKLTVKNGYISAPILSKGKGISKVMLCYTCDRNEDYQKREWVSQDAEIVRHLFAKDEVRAKLPEGVFQCFLSAYDEETEDKTCCGSSDFFFVPEK